MSQVKDIQTAENANSSNENSYFECEKGKVSSLNLDFGIAEVAVIPSENFSVETRGISASDIRFVLSDDGTLSISNVRRIKIDYTGFSRVSKILPRILVCIPKSVSLENIRISMIAGKFKCSAALKCKFLLLNACACDCIIKEFSCVQVKARSAFASLELSGKMSGGNSSLECAAGCMNVNLNGDETDFSYDARIALGDFKFNQFRKSILFQIMAHEKKKNHIFTSCLLGSLNVSIKKGE